MLQRLQASVMEARQDGSVAYIACKRRSGPTHTELREFPAEDVVQKLEYVAGKLTDMTYPSELTSWIDHCRDLADQLVRRSEQCLEVLQRIESLVPGSAAFYDCVSTLRRCLKSMITAADKLIALLSDPVCETNNKSLAATNMNDVWDAGRQAGLNEAAELVRATLQTIEGRHANSILAVIKQLPVILAGLATSTSSSVSSLDNEERIIHFPKRRAI